LNDPLSHLRWRVFYVGRSGTVTIIPSGVCRPLRIVQSGASPETARRAL